MSSNSAILSHPLATHEEFLVDVLEGLSRTPKTLPCKYFYDQKGSQLFDRICELPEYYPTRTEASILNKYAAEISAAIGEGATLIEFGSGSSTKTVPLLKASPNLAAYVPVDISRLHLLETAAALRTQLPELSIEPVVADFTADVEIPESLASEHQTVFFPGSTIGNFPPKEATQLLTRIAELVGTGGGLVIGIDLEKDLGVLEPAYYDSQNVTAAFNLNLLNRINRELQANFSVDQFAHIAFYNDKLHRIEMHLRSLQSQQVTIADESFDFAKDETIHTESSHKYTVERFTTMAASAGLRLEKVWTDSKEWFAVLHLLAE
ncbi:L-histidine N(alpha)-methyltransferase [Adhaeretor mobilis]|uniref:Histidine-specific methyltransferase EgtD n=1 Tax=Adhaeretor mobilis TaxID=1930276 RepID=A0A517MVG5_9BACT|nr:L-histidine N(alpha)-methyltransferase [Adhaeretor mobilis]QDS98870.1 Histidine-specific methyltransferase EgtD [Adhaeretor mobilis]